MDRLDDMLAFIKVVDAKSFTAAADRLNLSKSVVSRRIAELENRLGARLLNRTTRKLSLTEVGQAEQRFRRVHRPRLPHPHHAGSSRHEWLRFAARWVLTKLWGRR